MRLRQLPARTQIESDGYPIRRAGPCIQAYCRGVPLQCCAPQVEHSAIGGLRSLRPPCRDAEPHSVPLSGTQGGQDPGPPQPGDRLWKGIEDATSGWIFAIEQTVAGLQGLPQPADLLDDWQRAWDEVADADLEVEGEHDDADAATQRKRPDAWAVSWDKRVLLILEFTRPNDRCALSLHATDTFKTARYTPLRDRLARLLPAWEVDIQTYTVGIRGSHDPDRWHANLRRLGMTAARAERLMRGMVSQALTELTDLYSV